MNSLANVDISRFDISSSKLEILNLQDAKWTRNRSVCKLTVKIPLWEMRIKKIRAGKRAVTNSPFPALFFAAVFMVWIKFDRFPF